MCCLSIIKCNLQEVRIPLKMTAQDTNAMIERHYSQYAVNADPTFLRLRGLSGPEAPNFLGCLSILCNVISSYDVHVDEYKI
mmetsp:Transcript_25903/g.53084  ORF Transcript_25903/g.53084 Transcript_25903/m.53084 type:complete len:82 (+) Transcript_25903:85-330(+)